MRLCSLASVKTGNNLIKSDAGGGFRYIRESVAGMSPYSGGMSSWYLGKFENITDLHEAGEIKVKKITLGEDRLRQFITYELTYQNITKLTVTVSMNAGAADLVYRVKCNWLVPGEAPFLVPQLNFSAGLPYTPSTYRYDIPAGTIDREAVEDDRPGNTFIAAVGQSEHNEAVMLSTDTKYGYRGHDDNIGVSLIRSSFDPDPFPELGEHKFSIALSVTGCACPGELIKRSQLLYKPLSYITGKKHGGSMPLDRQFIEISGSNAVVSGIKMAEDGSGDMIVRLYNTSGQASAVSLEFVKPPAAASYADINEIPLGGGTLAVSGNAVTAELLPYAISTLRVEF
jgi:alpha-mannosidase